MINKNNNTYYDIKAQFSRGLVRLENEEFYFYGCFNNCFKIDDMILEALEDPEDGYRSSMGAVCHYSGYNDLLPRFFKYPLGKVKLVSMHDTYDTNSNYDMFNGWGLVDVDTNHMWLLFGTGNCDDYYPYFKFSYMPDQTQKAFPTVDPNYVPFKERHPELILKYPEWFSGLRVELGY